MRFTLRSAAVFAALLSTTLVATSSSAASMRWGGQVFGSWDTRAMDDWNQLIDDANEFGANYDNIENGFAFGVGPSVMINDQWELGLKYERVMASKSEDQGTEVAPTANAFGLTAGYWFPSSSTMNFGLQASVDYMTLASTLSDPSEELEITGSGVGFMFGAASRMAFSPAFSGVLSLGYRMADVEIEEIGGQDPTGSGLESEDYSGVVARVGFSFHQPRK